MEIEVSPQRGDAHAAAQQRSLRSHRACRAQAFQHRLWRQLRRERQAPAEYVAQVGGLAMVGARDDAGMRGRRGRHEPVVEIFEQPDHVQQGHVFAVRNGGKSVREESGHLVENPRGKAGAQRPATPAGPCGLRIALGYLSWGAMPPSQETTPTQSRGRAIPLSSLERATIVRSLRTMVYHYPFREGGRFQGRR